MSSYELTSPLTEDPPALKKKLLHLPNYLSSVALTLGLYAQSTLEGRIKHNDVPPLVMIVSIFLLLALGGAIILGAMALCLGYGRNFEAALRLNPFEIKVICN